MSITKRKLRSLYVAKFLEIEVGEVGVETTGDAWVGATSVVVGALSIDCAGRETKNPLYPTRYVSPEMSTRNSAKGTMLGLCISYKHTSTQEAGQEKSQEKTVMSVESEFTQVPLQLHLCPWG
jgi:hypothetical protein